MEAALHTLRKRGEGGVGVAEGTLLPVHEERARQGTRGDPA